MHTTVVYEYSVAEVALWTTPLLPFPMDHGRNMERLECGNGVEDLRDPDWSGLRKHRLMHNPSPNPLASVWDTHGPHDSWPHNGGVFRRVVPGLSCACHPLMSPLFRCSKIAGLVELNRCPVIGAGRSILPLSISLFVLSDIRHRDPSVKDEIRGTRI